MSSLNPDVYDLTDNESADDGHDPGGVHHLQACLVIPENTHVLGVYHVHPDPEENRQQRQDEARHTALRGVHANLPLQSESLAYDSARQRIVLFGGESSGALGDSWLWDGTNWSYYGSPVPVFDMTSRPNGIWNYTSIDVDSGVTVTFAKHAANAPVRWLATGNVNINGILSLDGANGGTDPSPGQEAPGGPGGFAGGLGGVRFDQSGSYAGTPGQGPGGGLPGVNINERGYNGTFAGTYGNSYLQPLIGGSGLHPLSEML